MTNRQWLESLSDEELAKEISNEPCKHCVYSYPSGCLHVGLYCDASEPSCDSGTLAWLQAEHKEI